LKHLKEKGKRIKVLGKLDANIIDKLDDHICADAFCSAEHQEEIKSESSNSPSQLQLQGAQGSQRYQGFLPTRTI